MKIGIISDIHGNLEALEAALTYIHSQRIDRIWCLGDIVGYGANPNECIDLIRKNCQIVIAGNHDQAALEKTDISYFNQYARASAVWTQQVLTEVNRNFLDGLPLTAMIDRVYLVHSTPFEPQEWHYVFSQKDALNQFYHFSTQLCFIGHSHVPVNFRDDGMIQESPFIAESQHRYLINIGSIGQPRDGNPLLSFSIYDDETGEIMLIRLSYPVERQVEKILKAGLPSFLGERLIKGV